MQPFTDCACGDGSPRFLPGFQWPAVVIATHADVGLVDGADARENIRGCQRKGGLIACEFN
jgi:hypothetical protein